MPRTFLILLLAAGLSACASTATENSAGEGDEAVAAETEEPKIRCYREKNTGFKLGGKRVCTPVDE